MDNRSISDVGGTSGGLGMFLLGFAMACIGGFLISHQVNVVRSYWSFWGGGSFGITLLPMLFGSGFCSGTARASSDGCSPLREPCSSSPASLANMHIYFQPTGLFNTMVMLILPVGGLVLIARSLRPYSSKPSE
jgi:hypothetical protein